MVKEVRGLPFSEKGRGRSRTQEVERKATVSSLFVVALPKARGPGYSFILTWKTEHYLCARIQARRRRKRISPRDASARLLRARSIGGRGPGGAHGSETIRRAAADRPEGPSPLLESRTRGCDRLGCFARTRRRVRPSEANVYRSTPGHETPPCHGWRRIRI